MKIRTLLSLLENKFFDLEYQFKKNNCILDSQLSLDFNK